MGYIKKLKSNELVGGTDKTTVYPVTSAEAVFEEVSENNFQSQKSINVDRLQRIETLEAHDENHEGRVSTLEEHDSDHESRVQELEDTMPDTVKSITINGSTKTYTVDDEGNVDLTIYTVDSDPEMPDIADNVRDLRNMVGTSTPVLETSHKTRIENLEATVGTGGTVDQRISNAVTIEKNRAQDIEGGLQTQINALEIGKQRALSVGSGITLTSEGVISATADPSVAKVVEALPTGDDIVNGLIYLVKTGTAGTYSQHVHSTSGWSDDLPNVSLGITTDDTLDSTSSNPIQNAAIAAQIGYFVCGNGYASSEIKDVDALGFKLPDVGGDFKIKMNAANTHAGPVYLRFNSSNGTKAELKYNRESVSPTNTWEENEVISVYYDGTYYQASNAQGGGASSKKAILPTATGKKITTSGTSIGSVSTDTNYQYAKYAVKEGDYVMISGAGTSNYRLWAIAKANNDIIDRAEANIIEENVLIKIPADGKWIVINNNNVTYPNPEWYYIAAGKDAHELLTESYLKRGTIRLKLGQSYYVNQNVKTTDGEQLRMTKEIKVMNTTDKIAIGDLKAYGTGVNANTYQAQKAVGLYDGTKNPYYTEGDYAIGRPATATIAFAANSATIEALTEAVPITVTIVGNACTVDVTSESDAASVATAIKDAFDVLAVEGWELLDDENGTLTLKSLAGLKTAPTVTSSVGASGITVTPTVTAGDDNLSQYDGSSWAAVSLATWVTDTSTDDPNTMWKTLTLDDLLTYTEQDYVPKLYNDFGQNTDGAINQKTSTEYLTTEVPINISLYPTKTCSITSTTWYTNGAKGRHKAIPVNEGDIFHIIMSKSNGTGSNVGWLTSAYTGTYSNGDSIPYVPGTSNIGGRDLVLVAPQGAAYLCLTIVDGAENSVSNTVYIYKSIKEKVSNDDALPTENSVKYVTSGGIYNALEKEIDTYEVIQSYNLAGYEVKNCSLGVTTWYMNGSKGRHKAIPVTANHYYRFNKRYYYGWLNSTYTGSYQNTNSIPFVGGTWRYVGGIGVIVKAPVGAAYLCVNTVDGAGTVIGDSIIEEVQANKLDLDYSKDMIGEYSDSYTIIDLTSYTPNNGVLWKGEGKWYIESGFKHIAVPVTGGEEYILKSKTTIYIGFLKSYSGSSSNPVYSDAYPDRISLNAGIRKITTPSDCTYVILSHTSGGTYCLPDLMCKIKILPWIIDKLTNADKTQIKLRFAHWNIGHFSYYDLYPNPVEGGPNTTITEEASEEMALRYKTMINKVSPDIFGVCEYNPQFDLAGNLAKDVIFQNYKYQFIGSRVANKYPCNSLFSNFEGKAISEVSYTAHVQGTYYKFVTFNIGNVEVAVVETHLDWGNGEPEGQPSTNTLQQQQLIDAFANYDHVIIGGDFNLHAIDEYQLFVDAGYTMASGSYLNHATYLSNPDPERRFLDNILVKGFAISNVKAWDESGYSENGLSDHSIISCDLLLQ